MRTLIVAAGIAVLTGICSVTANAAWDPGGNTPPNASQINRQAGVSQPVEPRADTTREGQIRGMIGSQ